MNHDEPIFDQFPPSFSNPRAFTEPPRCFERHGGRLGRIGRLAKLGVVAAGEATTLGGAMAV